MASLIKTTNISLLSLQSIASNAVVVGSAVDVSTKLAAFIGIHFGRRSASALTEGVEFRIEGSTKLSGDGHWFELGGSVKTGVVAAEAEAVSGTVAAAASVITVASTSNLGSSSVLGSYDIFIDNGTIANSEFHRIKSIVSNTSVTIEDALVNAQTGATIYTQAQFFGIQLDLTAIVRIRVVVNARNSGQATAAEVVMVTGDSIG